MVERPRAVGVLVFREPSERERDRLFASFGAAAGRERRRFVRAATGEFVAGQRTEERVDVGGESVGRQGIVGEGKGRARRVVVVGNFGNFGDIFRFRKIFRRRFELNLFVFGVFDDVVEDFVENEFVAHSGLRDKLHRVRQVDFDNEQAEEEEEKEVDDGAGEPAGRVVERFFEKGRLAEEVEFVFFGRRVGRRRRFGRRDDGRGSRDGGRIGGAATAEPTASGRRLRRRFRRFGTRRGGRRRGDGNACRGGVDRGGVDRGGVDRGGVDRGGVDRGGVDRGGVDRGGVDRGGGDGNARWNGDARGRDVRNGNGRDENGRAVDRR